MFEFRHGWKIIEMTIQREKKDKPPSALVTFSDGDKSLKLYLLNPRPIQVLSSFWDEGYISIRDQNEQGHNFLEFGRYTMQSWDANYEKDRIIADDVKRIEIDTA